MSYLFCNVGWMKDYKGQNENDEIVGGGSYIKQAYETITSIPLKQHIDAFGITIYKKCPVTG